MTSVQKVGNLDVGALIVSFVASQPAQAAFPVNVVVDGNPWLISTIDGPANNNIPELSTTPWFGNQTLASQFASAAFEAGGGTVQGG
jgi:hypothetical protein